MLLFRISKQSVTVVIDGRSRVVHSTSHTFKNLVEELNKPDPDKEKVRDYVDVRKFVAKVTAGSVQISDDEVRYNGAPVHSLLVERILEHVKEDISVLPLARFMERLMANPNTDVQKDLFEWLEAGEMPLTPEGWLVAYKKVGMDYLSFHSDAKNRIFNHTPGNVLSMPREDCDEDRIRTCSTGLHFCSHGYLFNYSGRSGRIVIVAIDPADVTAIPADYRLQKGRCCRYTVLGEVPEDEAKDLFTGDTRLVVGGEAFAPTHEKPSGYDAPDIYENSVDTDEQFESEEQEPETPAPTPEPKTAPESSFKMTHSLSFLHAPSGKSFSEDELKEYLATESQRTLAPKLGIPRSTLQGWIKKFS